MKSIISMLCLFISTTIFAQDKQILSEGTEVTIKLMQDLTSKKANVGDIVDFETTEPIVLNSKVVVPVGSKVTGKVTEASPRKMAGKQGMLSFSIDYLHLPNGKTVKLLGDQKGKGKNKAGAAIAEAVILTPLFLLKKGKDMKFEKDQY